MGLETFDKAVDLVLEGVDCETIWDEFVDRINEQGLRYCPLAGELLLDRCAGEEAGWLVAGPFYIVELRVAGFG